MTNRIIGNVLNPAWLLIAALIAFIILYEHFPREGWADAAIYSSYALVANAYEHVDGFGVALNGATYQHSRLGYLVPLRLFSDVFGPVGGRFIFNATLFLFFCISVLKFTCTTIKNRKNRALALIFTLFNPIVIISIVSGGADGPSAIFSFISLAAFYYGVKNRSVFYFFQAGIWFGLSFASHLFSVVPFSISLILLSLLHVSMRQNNVVSSSSERIDRIKYCLMYPITFILGFSAVITTLNTIGHQLGLKKFFLSYSLGRAQNSLQGSGEKFHQPIEFLTYNAALWIGLLPFLLISLAFLFRGLTKTENRRALLRLNVAILAILLPLLFVLTFDYFVGGSLLAAPHYYNAFIPCFVIGIISLFFSFDLTRLSPTGIFMLFGAILFCFMSAKFPHNNSASFAINGTDSRSLLASQVEFKNAVCQLVRDEVFNMVHPKSQLNDRWAYVDYFEGKKRSFNYLDTFAYTFPWVGDKMHKVDMKEAKINFELRRNIQTLIFSSDANELNHLLFLMKTSFGEHVVKAKECGGRGAYTWCLALIKYE